MLPFTLLQLAQFQTNLQDQGFVLIRNGFETCYDFVTLIQNITGNDLEIVGYSKGATISRPPINENDVTCALDGATPVLDVGSGAPPNGPVYFHHEMGYSNMMPRYVAFGCFEPAFENGVTRISSAKLLTQTLINQHPQLYNRFVNQGNIFQRNLHDAKNQDVYDWQAFFASDNITDILFNYNYSYINNTDRDTCSSDCNDIKDDKDRKTISYNETSGVVTIKWPIYPLAKIPETNEFVLTLSMLSTHGRYFDLWDDSYCTAQGIKYNLQNLEHRKRPYHSYWGNGDEFSQEEIELLTQIYDNNVIEMKLNKGDLILIDNLRYVHGRTSYVDTTTHPKLTNIKRRMGAVMMGLYDRKFWTPKLNK